MFSLSELSLVFKFSVLLQNLILNNESYCSKCQFFFLLCVPAHNNLDPRADDASGS